VATAKKPVKKKKAKKKAPAKKKVTAKAKPNPKVKSKIRSKAQIKKIVQALAASSAAPETQDMIAEILTGRDKSAREAKIRLEANKKAVLGCLKKNGVATVEIEWEGSGDSGWIESVVGLSADGKDVPFKEEVVSIHKEEGGWNFSGGAAAFQSNTVLKTMTIKDAVKNMVCDWLYAHHAGWENNDGGNGKATFDVEEHSIILTHHTNIITQETDEDEL
jgi:hypothetical protein